MNKQEKSMVMNEIDSYLGRLERNLPYLRSSCKFGLHKGKLGIINCIIIDLENLASALEEYDDDSFTLDDMEDYGKFNE